MRVKQQQVYLTHVLSANIYYESGCHDGFFSGNINCTYKQQYQYQKTSRRRNLDKLLNTRVKLKENIFTFSY